MATRSNKSTKSATVAVNVAPLQGLVEIVIGEARSLAESDARGADWLVGSMLLALANRAAFEVKNNDERMDSARRVAKGITQEFKDGIEQAPEPVRREIDKQANVYTLSLSRSASYQQIYNSCAAAWESLKGTPMPDQFRTQPSDSKSSAQTRDAFLAVL